MFYFVVYIDCGNISENDYKYFFYYDLVVGVFGYEFLVFWIGIEG